MVGLTLLLVDAPPRRGAVRDGRVLRDDTRRGAARVRRRLAWYGLGSGSSSRCCTSPRAAGGPVPGHRATGSAPCSAGSSSLRSAWPRPWPSRRSDITASASRTSASYPGALAELDGHGVHRRGHVPWRDLRDSDRARPGGECLEPHPDAALCPGHAARGAGRDRYLLATTIGIGLIGGWLTAVTGGIAAAFLGHAVTRFAIFLCTGHTGQTLPRGREVEEIEKRRRPPDGWRVIGTRESAVAGPVNATRRRRGRPATAAAPAGRALRPRPVLRLALPVLRLRRLCGRGGARAAGPGRGLPGGGADGARPAGGRARRAVRASVAAGRSRRVYLGGGTPSLLPGRRHRATARARARAVRHRRRRRDHARGEPRAGRARRPRGLAPRRRHPRSRSGPSRSTTPSCGGSDGATGPRTSRRRWRALGTAGIASINLDLLYDVAGRHAGDVDRDARRGPGARSGPPVALCADPRRPGRGGAHRVRAATTCRPRAAPGAGANERGRPRTRTAPRPSTTTPPPCSRTPGSAATRSRTGRGRATRAATTSPTGSAVRTRRSGPGAHAFDGAVRRWNAARLEGYVGCPDRPAVRTCRPAARTSSTARPRPPRP